MPPARALSLRLALLFPMLWRLPARLNFTLPVAVKLNRFAAAFLVFCFMTSFAFSSVTEPQTDFQTGSKYFKAFDTDRVPAGDGPTGAAAFRRTREAHPLKRPIRRSPTY